MCPVLWDITDLHYDRTNCKMFDEELLNSMMSVKPIEPPVITPTESPINTVLGDVNNDSEYTVADIVLLSNWLLNAEKTLANGKAADFNKDGTIDVFDLCLARY